MNKPRAIRLWLLSLSRAKLESTVKPYYEENGITIYNADCREVFPSLPQVDLVFADPFYVPPNVFDWRLFDELYWKFNREWLAMLQPLIAPDGHCFISFLDFAKSTA